MAANKWRIRCHCIWHGVLIAAVLLCFGCARPDRPANVAEGSTWVQSVKGGYWQHCEGTSAGQTHCTVWNQNGKVLVDDVFLAIDNGPIAPETLVRLRTAGPCTGTYQVCLADGRILLPASRFDELKAFIEGRPRQD